MEFLSNDLRNKLCDKLWTASGSLKGVGGLFIKGTKTSGLFLDSEESHGLGQLFSKISEELGVIEDILRSGENSNELNGPKK